MNTKNNKRRQDSQDRIETAFMELLKVKDLNKITVAEICKLAPCNRSTFYANFLDVFDLADTVRRKLEEHYGSIFLAQGEASDNYLLLKFGCLGLGLFPLRITRPLLLGLDILEP